MDQRSDYIRQDIESTRAALDDKLDTLETKAREAFDIKHQVAERPWMMLGAALATGYVLGSMGTDEPEQRWQGHPMATVDYSQHATHQAIGHNKPSHDNGLLAQFDDEIDMLKTAAVSALKEFLRGSIREYVPAMGQHLDAAARERTFTPTSSPGGSMQGSTQPGTTNYEGIPETTSYGSNRVAHRTSFASEGDSQPAEEQQVGASTTRR